jgi:hypothetical protein
MNDCLASTGATVPVPFIIGALVLALIGGLLVARSHRGRAAVLSVLVVAGVAALVGAPATSAQAADCAPTPTASAAPSIAGTWQGEVSESIGLPYTIVTAIADDGTTASAATTYFFGDDSCDAVWTQVSRSAGQVVFLETVDESGLCLDQGTITITFDPANLSGLLYAYSLPGELEPIESATLVPATAPTP